MKVEGYLDTELRYGSVSRFNHWVGALLVVGLLAIGLYFHDMPQGDEKFFWIRLHASIGMLGFAFLLFRILWRAMITGPQPAHQSRKLSILTVWSHRLILFLIVVLLVSGPFAIWSGGRPINVFDWVVIPGPIGKWTALHEILENIHGLAGRILMFLVIGHIVMAAKHHFVDKDQVMKRMTGA
ncbi:cytochrome b [Motiliproteus sp. MSK22-1]|uniref:cytochrome b n=1 Tax=Motiliproteus sp. MSK22-1 TaxID=1897630 RepID=UPI000977E4D8|nr:cytochrome b/b6 domain-containing protein [Motiliproteus sp. MSK22-1]OMH25846.1 hypothetical protein BGP75_25355 [Motiliproteus sp. MSK22-1]